MANDAGYPFGTDENEHVAAMLEEDYRRQQEEYELQKEMERLQYEHEESEQGEEARESSS